MAAIKKKTKSKNHKITNVREDVVPISNYNFCAFLVGIQNGTDDVENSMVIPQKVKDKITI